MPPGKRFLRSNRRSDELYCPSSSTVQQVQNIETEDNVARTPLPNLTSRKQNAQISRNPTAPTNATRYQVHQAAGHSNSQIEIPIHEHTTGGREIPTPHHTTGGREIPTPEQTTGGREIPTDQTTGGVTASNTVTKRRGKALNATLNKHIRRAERPKIVIEKGKTRPVGKWANEFIREVGIAARYHMPFNCKSWYDIKDDHLLPIYDRITDKFDIDLRISHQKEAINNVIQQRFREYRSKLNKYFEEKGANESALRKPYEGVSQGDWEMICQQFMSEKYQARSEVNADNRKKLNLNHCGGSKPFIQHLYDLQHPATETNEAASGVFEMYKRVHYNEKKGWTHENAKEKYDAMIAAQTEASEASAHSGGETTITEDEIFHRVVGTRKGYARGLGYGVCPPPSSRVNVSNREELEQSQRRAEEAEKVNEELQQHIKSQEDKIQSQEEKIQSQEEKIQAQQERIAAMEARHKMMEDKMDAFFRSH